MVVFAVTLLFLGHRCYQAFDHPEVREAQWILWAMIDEDRLDEVGFFDAYPDAHPSEFLYFLQSPEGDELWSARFDLQEPTDDGPDYPFRSVTIDDQIISILFESAEPDLPGRQIVLSADDPAGVLVLHTHLRGDRPARTELRWDFPRE